MYVCSDGHDEIVHEDEDCPLCRVIETLRSKEDEIIRLEEAVGELEADLTEERERREYMQMEIADLTRELDSARDLA